jgi:DNA-binding IscR family transcriptional regulator
MSFDLVVRNGEARAEAAPVIQRLYYPPGFTDKVLALLRAEGAIEVSGGCIEGARSGHLALIQVADIYEARNIPAPLLKRIANLLPKEQLRDSWNGRPEFRVFLRVASRVDRALFDAFIVPKMREDERVSVYAAYLPLYPPHLLKWAVEELTWRSAQPDGVGVVQRGRTYYLMLYWD